VSSGNQLIYIFIFLNFVSVNQNMSRVGIFINISMLYVEAIIRSKLVLFYFYKQMSINRCIIPCGSSSNYYIFN